MLKSPPTHWLTVSEAAEMANVSRWTIWRWISEGVIPGNHVLRVGKARHRVSQEWVLGHIDPAARPVPPTTQPGIVVVTVDELRRIVREEVAAAMKGR